MIAYKSWKILKDQCSTNSDLKTARLMKEFSAALIIIKETCTHSVKRVKGIVSELRACGTSINRQNMAYTILIGLPKEYSALVITLTNVSTTDSPLVLEKIVEVIYTEEEAF